MKIDKKKLDIELARRCMSATALCNCGVSSNVIARIRHGAEIKPVTVGIIAKALGVDPLDIIEQESNIQTSGI